MRIMCTRDPLSENAWLLLSALSTRQTKLTSKEENQWAEHQVHTIVLRKMMGKLRLHTTLCEPQPQCKVLVLPIGVSMMK